MFKEKAKKKKEKESIFGHLYLSYKTYAKSKRVSVTRQLEKRSLHCPIDRRNYAGGFISFLESEPDHVRDTLSEFS